VKNKLFEKEKIMKILVIEDNIQAHEIISQVFGDHKLVIAENYEEAMQALDEFHPEIVLTDVFFPEGRTSGSADTFTKIMLVILRYTDEKYYTAIQGLGSYWDYCRDGGDEALYSAFEDFYKDERPFGALVVLECIRRGIPIGVVSSCYHHGVKYEPVHRLFGLIQNVEYWYGYLKHAGLGIFEPSDRKVFLGAQTKTTSRPGDQDHVDDDPDLKARKDFWEEARGRFLLK
jgi:hypothetical protein